MADGTVGTAFRGDVPTTVVAEGDGVVLEGLDGGTPLGFLAGLGAQRILADRASVSDNLRCSPGGCSMRGGLCSTVLRRSAP